MDLTSILAGFFGLLTVVVGARLTYVNQQNIKLREGLNKKKQQTYFGLLEFLTKLQDMNDATEEETAEIVRSLKSYFKEIMYYGSPGVLKALGDYMHFFYSEFDSERDITKDETNIFQFKLYGELVIQIRKDLGHVKWTESESWLDVIRLTIKDIDEYIPEKFRADRGKKSSPPITINGKNRS